MTITVITGTTNGIGLVTAKELAKQGHQLIMLCRNTDAAQRLTRQINLETQNSNVTTIPCDLASLESIQTCINKLKQEVDRIDLLINNAGLIAPTDGLSQDGFELSIAVNHIGPFFLTRSLEKLLNGGQVINLASKAHHFCSAKELFAENNFQTSGPYKAFKAYARSKLANILFSFYFAEKHKGTIASHCLHPGSIATNIVPTHNGFFRGLNSIWKKIGPSPIKGARTTLYLALSPRESITSGLYWENCKPAKVSKAAQDRSLQESCWAESNRMAGLA